MAVEFRPGGHLVVAGGLGGVRVIPTGTAAMSLITYNPYAASGTKVLVSIHTHTTESDGTRDDRGGRSEGNIIDR